jgi:type I restriction enzyme S subunit
MTVTESWHDVRIRELARVVGGGTPATGVSSYWSGPIPWFTPAEISEDGSGEITKSSRTITVDGLKSSAAKLLPAGTILVTSRASIGNCAIAGVPVTTNQGFASLVPHDRRSTRFLYYWIQQNRSRLVQRAAGSTFLEISAAKVADLELSAPDLGTQEQIGSMLADADRAIATLKRLVTKKEAVKRGMMQQLLTGKTRVPGFTADWTTRKVGDFAHVTAGGTPSTSVARYWGGAVLWMSSGELHRKRVSGVAGRITEDGLNESSAQLLPKGSVLIGLAGQGKTRGTVAISRAELATNQSIAGILPSPSHCPEFLYYNLDARYDELRGMSTGGSGRGGLNLTLIRNVSVLMPDVAEQGAIAGVLADIDDELEALTARLTKAKAVKQGMMQELLTGRTCISVTEVAAA